MAKQMNGNGAYAPTSLEAWNEHTTEIIQLTEHLAVEIQSVDFLALLTAGDGTNPLLALMQEMVDRDEKGITQDEDGMKLEMAQIMKDPDKLRRLVEGLDRMLTQIVINPPLLEQGHENGVPLIRLKSEWKFKIFDQISGGSAQLEAAQRFLEKEGGSLVVAQPG